MSEIRFVQAGDGTHVAYQILDGDDGDDGIDVVMVSGFYFPIEAFPDDPVCARLLDGLAGLGRLAIFDRRGVGLSDAISDWDRPLLDQWAEDLAAVVDAADFPRPSVFGWDIVGVARRFATEHPERVDRLVLLEPLPPPESPDDPRFDDWRAATTGRADEVVPRAFPHRVGDPSFRTWLDRAGRRGASPTLAARIADTLAEQASDEPTDHGAVRAPTLVLRRPHAGLFPPQAVAQVADLVPGAELVDLPGTDSLVVGEDVDVLIAEASRFLTGTERVPPPKRELCAILFTDLVASTDRLAASGDTRWSGLLDRHDDASRRAVSRRGGEIVKPTGDGVLATLPSASAALGAASEIRRALDGLDLPVRIGIHVGELERKRDDVAGLAVHAAARVMGCAGAGEVLVSVGVVTAVVGSEFVFDPRGRHDLKGVPGSWDLYAVTRFPPGS